MTDVLLALSTHIKEPKKFTVDGAEYKLLGLDHLSPSEETLTMALFSRHSLLGEELSMTRDTKKGQRVAQSLKEARLTLLTKLTDMPIDVARKLPITAQVKLLETIEQEVSAEIEEEADDGSAEAEADES